MGLFGGSSKGMDTGKLRTMFLQGLGRQRGEVEKGFAQLPQFSQQFEKKQGELGQGFVDTSRQQAMDFGRNLENIDTSDMVKQRQAKAQELAFRNLPAAQQALRENLAATGGLNRGAAIRSLQQPVLQASQQAADQAFNIQSQADQDTIARREQALEGLFKTEQGAALQKLGIDKDTARLLMENGRSDVLERASALAGIESARTQGLLDIELARQQDDIRQDQAKSARRGALLGSLGSLAGAGAGMALTGGSPMGAMLGGQLGGSLGGLAGGQQANFTPGMTNLAMLLAARQRQQGLTNPVASKAGVEELRQRVPFPGMGV